jgi:hypothetical protein
MKLDVTGSILLGFGVLSSVVSKTGSTEYNLALYDQILVASLIIAGLSMVGISVYREYRS